MDTLEAKLAIAEVDIENLSRYIEISEREKREMSRLLHDIASSGEDTGKLNYAIKQIIAWAANHEPIKLL